MFTKHKRLNSLTPAANQLGCMGRLGYLYAIIQTVNIQPTTTMSRESFQKYVTQNYWTRISVQHAYRTVIYFFRLFFVLIRPKCMFIYHLRAMYKWQRWVQYIRTGTTNNIMMICDVFRGKKRKRYTILV